MGVTNRVPTPFRARRTFRTEPTSITKRRKFTVKLSRRFLSSFVIQWNREISNARLCIGSYRRLRAPWSSCERHAWSQAAEMSKSCLATYCRDSYNCLDFILEFSNGFLAIVTVDDDVSQQVICDITSRIFNKVEFCRNFVASQTSEIVWCRIRKLLPARNFMRGVRSNTRCRIAPLDRKCSRGKRN